ncbi:MAG: YdeI/OmpD-associated family protein [Cyclobacteriaceae bacterium]|nr:YdeI/OmpD-associated family protein [Cyclobacteriaceae bacterium]
MTKTDKRIDAYITKAQPFAQPILKHVRALVHKACPEVTETIKWGMPSFDYKGPYFSFASFKQHCAFGFWKAKLINDPKNYLGLNKAAGGEAMGNFGRVTNLKDLPPDKVIIDFLKQAKKLNDDGVKVAPKKTVSKDIKAPVWFMDALKKNKIALTTFENFSPSHKREYLEWVTEAKTEATRERRLTQAIEWMAEGKPRNWKYMKK